MTRFLLTACISYSHQDKVDVQGTNDLVSMAFNYSLRRRPDSTRERDRPPGDLGSIPGWVTVWLR